MSETILVGDVGGTNARLAVVRADAAGLSLSPVWKRPGKDFPTFADALDAYLDETGVTITGAAFGFAGAVVKGQVSLLNGAWSVDRGDLSRKLGIERVVLVNDFFAMSRGAPELSPSELVTVAPGEADPEGSIAVGGPGTGFGIGVLRRTEAGWVVVAGEGGHQVYAPQTELEFRTAELLRARGIYVSNEIIAAGAGFEDTRACLAEALGVPDPKTSQADIIAAAGKGDAFALELCRLRARCVMTVMGNLALSAWASGGIYLAGGISPRLLPWLTEQAAMDRFFSRGPRTELIAKFPIRVITGDAAPLLGAAHLWLDEQARGWI